METVRVIGVVAAVIGLLWGVFGSFSRQGGGGIGWVIFGIGGTMFWLG